MAEPSSWAARVWRGASHRVLGRGEVEAGHIRALITLAGNPVVSAPNGARIARALDKLDTMVSLDLYKNETTSHAHVFLPTTFGLEREHFDLAAERRGGAETSRAGVASASLRLRPGVRDSDWAILLGLGVRHRQARRRGHSGPRRFGPPRWATVRALGPRRIFDAAMRAGAHRTSVRALEKAPARGRSSGPSSRDFAGALYTRRPSAASVLRRSGFSTTCVRDLRAAVRHARARTRRTRAHRSTGTLRSNNSWMHNSPSPREGPPKRLHAPHAFRATPAPEV